MLKIKHPMNKLMNKKGFTLVELIVVIAIIAILAAILIPVVTNYVSDARQAAVDANAQTFALALQTTFADLISNSSFGEAEDLLAAIEAADDWTPISTLTANDVSPTLKNVLGSGFSGYVALVVSADSSIEDGVQVTEVQYTTEDSDTPSFVGIYPR